MGGGQVDNRYGPGRRAGGGKNLGINAQADMEGLPLDLPQFN